MSRDFLKPSIGLEPMTPPYHALQSATSRNQSQRIWLVLAVFTREGLATASACLAAAMLHKRSILGARMRAKREEDEDAFGAGYRVPDNEITRIDFKQVSSGSSRSAGTRSRSPPAAVPSGSRTRAVAQFGCGRIARLAISSRSNGVAA